MLGVWSLGTAGFEFSSLLELPSWASLVALLKLPMSTFPTYDIKTI